MSSLENKSAGGGRRSIGEEINRATKSLHATSNTLIVSRLSLAIPPGARTPSNYATGLLHLAPIFIAFESLWSDLLKRPDGGSDRAPTCCDDCAGCHQSKLPSNRKASARADRSPLCDRLRLVLGPLYMPGLLRSDPLRCDIASITGWPIDMVEEQIRLVADTNHVQQLISRITAAIEQKPHILLAYAWVLYMAVFSGGRFLRASLEVPGDYFWATTCHPVQPSNEAGRPSSVSQQLRAGVESPELPLSFFRFRTPSDGEDLRLEFKKQLAQSESLLTAPEREHIVQEAVHIFEDIIALVSHLDGLLETPTTTVGSDTQT